MLLRHATLAEAQALLAANVRETSENWGPVVREILAAANVREPAPWCMATVTYCSNNAADDLGRENPLDAVKWEASVDSLVAWVDDPDSPGRWVEPSEADAGDLAVYNWEGDPGGDFDHIGITAKPPGTGHLFRVIEGNRNDQMDDPTRDLRAGYDVRFARWDELPLPTIDLATGIEREPPDLATRKAEGKPLPPRVPTPHAKPRKVIRADADPSAVETVARWTGRLLPAAGALLRVFGARKVARAADAVAGVVGQITGRR